MTFVLKGTRYALYTSQVLVRMVGIKPKPITKHYVIVNRFHYPVKQVIRECLGVGLTDFGTKDAIRLLGRLGFKSHKRVVRPHTRATKCT